MVKLHGFKQCWKETNTNNEMFAQFFLMSSAMQKVLVEYGGILRSQDTLLIEL
jgi:hypothetical protein